MKYSENMKAELFALAGIGLFFVVLALQPAQPLFSAEIPNQGFVVVSVSVNNSDMALEGDCRRLSMTVSDHQALSIASALDGKYYIRPLTHDIMKDIFDNYGIALVAAHIDAFTDGVYTAKIYINKDSKMLEVDARPTDAVGLALRMGVPVYFNKELLDINGEKTC